MRLDPDGPGPLGAARVAGSTATFLVALVTATLLHTALLLLAAVKTPAQETGIESGSSANSTIEILILPGEEMDGEAIDPAALPADSVAPPSDRIAASAHAEPAANPAPLDEPPMDAEDEALSEPATRLEVPPEPEPEPVDVEEVSVQPAREPPPTAPVETPDPMAAREPTIDAARILASRGAEIDRLVGDQNARSIAHASRVRRKSISAGTHEFRYASYLSAWARKVERIGNLNYPQAAREQRMFGTLVLQVAVKSDGSLEQVRVVRSSGYELLDEAAIRIVELAAPFAPFPPDIAAETDLLDIVRTWQFLQGGRLGWEQP